MRTYARAPVRIDPAGGGTDAPPYSLDHGGCVLNISVARHIHACFELLDRSAGVTVHSFDLEREIHAEAPEAFTLDGDLDLLKAFIKRLVPAGTGCRLTTQSDLPERSGLGGSGALGVAVVAAITRAFGQSLDPAALAELANDVERTDLGSPGGSQDSYGGAFPGAKQITYHRDGTTACEVIPLAPEVQARLERSTLLVYTGAPHLSGSIHADIKHSYALPDSPTVAAMNRLKEQAIRAAGALRAGDLETYADAMNLSRGHHYALHPSCDSAGLREYFAALDPYIMGGKTCGAGGGGFIVIHSKPDCRHLCWRTAESLGGRVWPMVLDGSGVMSWEA